MSTNILVEGLLGTYKYDTFPCSYTLTCQILPFIKPVYMQPNKGTHFRQSHLIQAIMPLGPKSDQH